MSILGWRRGKIHVIVTDDPARLARFAELMDRTEYMQTEKRSKQ